MLTHQPSAGIPRSAVAAVVFETMIAQVASIMGVAVFPVIAPKLAMDLGVEPALIGYQISLTTWNFAGILIGPALFATVYKFIGSYALTYGLLALIAAAGLGLLLMCAAAARRETAKGNGK